MIAPLRSSPPPAPSARAYPSTCCCSAPATRTSACCAADCQVELQPLCRAAKVELIVEQAVGLTAAQRRVRLGDGRTLEASWLSLNVGAEVARPPQQGEAMHLLALFCAEALLAGHAAGLRLRALGHLRQRRV